MSNCQPVALLSFQCVTKSNHENRYYFIVELSGVSLKLVVYFFHVVALRFCNCICICFFIWICICIFIWAARSGVTGHVLFPRGDLELADTTWCNPWHPTMFFHITAAACVNTALWERQMIQLAVFLHKLICPHWQWSCIIIHHIIKKEILNLDDFQATVDPRNNTCRFSLFLDLESDETDHTFYTQFVSPSSDPWLGQYYRL